MTFRDHVRLWRECWRLIVACLILGLCGAAAVTYLQPRTYSADTRLYVASQITPDSASSARELALLAEQRVRSYQELVRSDRIAQEVVTRLNLPLTADEVRRRLAAEAALDTVVLTITATDSSPTRAADIANAAAGLMVRLVDELEQPPEPAQAPPVIPAAQVQPVMLRIVEPARPPAAPDWPNPPLNLAAGAAFGLLIGAGLAGLRRTLDDTVRTAGQLRSLTRAPVLGVVGYSRRMARRALSPGELWQLREADPIRQTRTALLLLLKRGGGNVVGVTSTVRDEGHTAALCNLAVATADAGLKVVLIDGDLRRPNLSRYFGLEPEPGLRSLLIGDAPLADAVRPAEVNLDLVSSAPVAADATALLTSKAMADLVATLRRRYDIVLVNVPPLLSDAAAALVASNTDGCILVVPYGRTSENDVAEATEILKSASVRLLGTMMTMVPHGARVRDAGGGRRIVAAPERSAPVPHAASADESPAAPPPLAAAPVSDDGNGHGPAMPTAVTAALRPGGLPSPRPRDSGPPAG